LTLYDEKKKWVVNTTRSQYAIAALDFFFTHPVFSSSHFVAQADVPAPTARRILKLCCENGLLRTLREPSGQQSGVFVFSDLLNIAEGRSVF